MRLPEIQNRLFDWLDEELGQKVSRKPNSVVGNVMAKKATRLAEKTDRSPR